MSIPRPLLSEDKKIVLDRVREIPESPNALRWRVDLGDNVLRFWDATSEILSVQPKSMLRCVQSSPHCVTSKP
jgi:hypothetical protein